MLSPAAKTAILAPTSVIQRRCMRRRPLPLHGGCFMDVGKS
jgi:hypothetical protein